MVPAYGTVFLPQNLRTADSRLQFQSARGLLIAQEPTDTVHAAAAAAASAGAEYLVRCIYSLLSSALYAKRSYYLVLYMQCFLIMYVVLYMKSRVQEGKGKKDAD